MLKVMARHNLAAGLAVSSVPAPTMEELIEKFLTYCKYEKNLRPQTIYKYRQSLKSAVRELGRWKSLDDLVARDIAADARILKMKLRDRGVGESGVNSVLFALRGFLGFCRERYKINADPKEIKTMRVPRKPVIFLTADELQRFFSAMRNERDVRVLRMRAYCELILATGMRKAEALSLNKYDIDWRNLEATVNGKGGKQRLVYLTSRAVYWLELYFARRSDHDPSLFVTTGRNPRRWTGNDMSKQFKVYAKRAGLRKAVTPHTLRRTMGSLLLDNGCDIRFIQEILGHSDIKTTAKYYLGTDKRAVKAAHKKFLHFD